ncbi:MAG: DUF86 domain-containing protein [Planctomycetes bacterium]|nr:DUF86 domain-containing protein [Planctomycetota bacterium]
MHSQEVQRKADTVAECLVLLAGVPQGSFEEFSADPLRLPATLHLLQTAIQALIDLGGVAVAREGVRAPDRSRDILENLERGGHLPPGSTGRFAPMFSFRNRVVHLYDRVDPRKVYEILRQNRADLRDLLELLLAILDDEGDAR